MIRRTTRRRVVRQLEEAISNCFAAASVLELQGNLQGAARLELRAYRLQAALNRIEEPSDATL